MIRVYALVLVAVTLTGCSEKKTEPRSPVIATVGKEAISTDLLDYYVQREAKATPDQVGPALKQQLQTHLMGIAAAAQSSELLDRPSLRAAIELSRLELLASAAAEAAGVNAPPTDKELQEAYDTYVAGLATQEYHVAQIQVATEASATDVLARLSKGERFAEIARTVSADESRARGGDLGWIVPERLPPAFVQAVQHLKIGEYTHQAVQTPYGWHLIELLEMRAASPPTLESVHAQLIANMKAQRYQHFLDDSLDQVKRH